MAINYHRVKKDTNQDAIKAVLEAYGAVVINCTALKNAFDLLVLYKGNSYICEVKQPKGNLSEGELKCKYKVESVGVKYHVLRTCEDALEMINK